MEHVHAAAIADKRIIRMAAMLPLLAITSVISLLPLTAWGAPPPDTTVQAIASSQVRAGSPVINHPTVRFGQGSSVTVCIGRPIILAPKTARGLKEWRSSDPFVARIDSAGLVRAKRPGTALITATYLDTGDKAICLVKTYRKRTQKQARRAILALRSEYKVGRTWDNRNHYFWQAATRHCYGCAAFAALASDTAFGKYAPFRRHSKFAKIRIGDHVRIGNSHSAIVIRKRANAIVVAEGNYAGTFKWGRVITRSSLIRAGFFVETRYG